MMPTHWLDSIVSVREQNQLRLCLGPLLRKTAVLIF